MSDRVCSHRLGPPLLAALLATGPVQAQIVTDGTVGPKVSLRGGQIEIGANLGSRRGDNLFHSFEKFGIATGQSATFTGPGTIKNVISRVTGGEISNIDGKLASRVGQADFYFLNPAGVMFGPNAQLDVPGSLHVSTAHELRFADGTRFSAMDKTGSGLTVAPPEAFGFLDRPAGRLAVEGGQMRLRPGKQLSLAGGTIDIAGGSSGSLATRGGTVTLTSIDGAGQSRISDGAVDAARQGAIRLSNHAQIVTNGNGGTIQIRSGALDVSNGAMIQARTEGTEDGGAVDISAHSIRLSNGGAVKTESTSLGPGAGLGGPITIVATDTLQLDRGTIQTRSYSGDGGNVKLSAGRLFVMRNSMMWTSVAGADFGGIGGNISIDSPLMVFDGRSIQANAFGGPGGNIALRVGQLIRTPDSLIQASGALAGNVVIAKLNDSLVALPGTFLDTGSQLRETCAARGGRPTSSFVSGGRGGLPPDPSAPLAANPFGQPLEQQTATGLPTALTPRPPQAAKPIMVAGTPQPVLGSPRLACRG